MITVLKTLFVTGIMATMIWFAGDLIAFGGTEEDILAVIIVITAPFVFAALTRKHRKIK